MRRPTLVLLLAAVVTFPLAEAIGTTLDAIRSSTTQAWLLAAGDAATAGIFLVIAVVLLRASDRPQRRALWLLDRRVLLRRRTAVAGNASGESQRA